MLNNTIDMSDIDELEKLFYPNSGAEKKAEMLLSQDLSNSEYNKLREFLTGLYEDEEVDNIVKHASRRKVPLVNGQKPVIKAVVVDWDGTIGAYYEKHALVVDTLLHYVSKTRDIPYDFLQEQLKEYIADTVVNSFKIVGHDLFTKDGIKRILETMPLAVFNPSKPLSPSEYERYSKDFSAEDKKFVDSTLAPMLDETNGHVYDDMSELLNILNKKQVPVFVHTESSLDEFVDKLLATSDNKLIKDEDKPILFERKNGKLTVKRCAFVGFSIPKPDKEELKNKPEIKEVLDALASKDIDIIWAGKKKPEAEPLNDIKKSLNKRFKFNIKNSEMLMLGDMLQKDVASALEAGQGMYSAVSFSKMVQSDLLFRMNAITAAWRPSLKKHFLKQLKEFSDKYWDKRSEEIIKTLAVCNEYTDLPFMFDFRGIEEEKDNAYKLVKIPMRYNSKDGIFQFPVRDVSNRRGICPVCGRNIFSYTVNRPQPDVQKMLLDENNKKQNLL